MFDARHRLPGYTTGTRCLRLLTGACMCACVRGGPPRCCVEVCSLRGRRAAVDPERPFVLLCVSF